MESQVTHKSSKTELLNILSLIQEDLISFSNELTPLQKQLSGTLTEWSAKDTITHLVFWNNNFITQVENAKKGERPPLINDYLDQINDGVFIEHSDQPYSDAFEELLTSISRATEVIGSFTSEEIEKVDLFDYLNGHPLVDRILGTFGWHIPHHISDYFVKNGEMGKAITLQEKYADFLQKFPTWKVNSLYNLACFYAQNEMAEKAIRSLKSALTQKPELVDWSKKDPDLDSLRELAEYQALYRMF